MTTSTSIVRFFTDQPSPAAEPSTLRTTLQGIFGGHAFRAFLPDLIHVDPYSDAFGRDFAAANAIDAISAARILRGSFNLPLGQFFSLLGQLATAFPQVAANDNATAWTTLADSVLADTALSSVRLRDYLTVELEASDARLAYADLVERLVEQNPHAVYPTSDYRACDGSVESTADGLTIEAVMTLSTFAKLKIVDRSLSVEQTGLSAIYRPLGRCVCLIDENVEAEYGPAIDAYFAHHRIPLQKRVYRAMEADKGIGTVERMLGDFKAMGVSRNEPVLIVGGGVLADTGGLACALYGRGTPYVMLATSIVTGIDAGPSPRTCCDGFGYKNLLGAYHPPVLCITDRYFFQSLKEGWLRHGIAEIIKMGVIADADLFADLEAAQDRLIDTRFGTVGCEKGDAIETLSQKILGAALRAYVVSEYDNLYETHQCRPHAYGHTWSPGFELEAGLLHGHAVAICMGFGAYLSRLSGWITEDEMHRILKLMDGYGLSLWHDILRDKTRLWKSQQTVIQKRGGNLVAPLPKGAIGQCGYLNVLDEGQLHAALDAYEAICRTYPRQGRGIDPLCIDVGLEDPASTQTSRPVVLHG